MHLLLEDAFRELMKQGQRGMQGASLAEDHAVETGGLLAGTVDGTLIVTAGSPGQDAQHSQVSFVTDPHEDALTLAAARHRWGAAISDSGRYHLHLFHMPFLSGTDHEAARALDEARGSQYPLLIGLLCPDHHGTELRLHLFVWDRQHNREIRVEYEVVAEDDERVRRILTDSTATLDATASNSDFWKDAVFQFYNTEKGKSRLRCEIQETEAAGFGISTFQAVPSLHCVLRAKSEIGIFTVVFPPEYPLNAPRVFAPSGHEFVTATITGGWSSDRRLVHVLKECRKLLKSHFPRFLSPTSKVPSWVRIPPTA
jgi:hypothetical protein